MSTSTPTHRLRPTTIAKALGLLAVSTVPLLVRSGGAAAPAVTLESGGVADADRAELLALVDEYAWLVDHVGRASSTGSSPVTLSCGSAGTAYRGPDGLTAYAGWREQRSGRKTHHQMTNVRLEVVDRDHVTGTAGWSSTSSRAGRAVPTSISSASTTTSSCAPNPAGGSAAAGWSSSRTSDARLWRGTRDRRRDWGPPPWSRRCAVEITVAMNCRTTAEPAPDARIEGGAKCHF
jgi:hypothetical protein